MKKTLILTLNSSSVRAPAGCVAVAASEVLYYLHNKLGVPESMHSYGYCSGDILNYTQYFSVPSTTIWSQMDSLSHLSNNLADAEAIMIGSVGSTVVMHFDYNIFNGQYFSWALPANIRTHLFSNNGITSAHGDYDATIVKRNLSNYLPVIVTASDQVIPANGAIHCFVIDGFQKMYKMFTHYHYWAPDDPWNPKGSPLNHDPYYTYTYSTPEITSIKINWGWKSQWTLGANEGWYGLTANWAVTTDHSFNYNHNVEIIYDMAIAN
jgi:hypothetical protein